MPRTNAPIVIKKLANGQYKHFIRMTADKGDSVEWEIVNHTGEDLINVTVDHFSPSTPVTNIQPIKTLSGDKNIRGKIKANVKSSAGRAIYTFDIMSDVHGMPTVIADPEIEVILDLLMKKTKKGAKAKSTGKKKPKAKKRSRK